MALVNFPYTAATDWSGDTNYNQLIRMYHERASATAGISITTPAVKVVGQTVSRRNDISTLQTLIQGLATGYINHVANPDGFEGVASTNLMPGEPFDESSYRWTLAAIRAEAGINSAGFTRVVPDGGGYTVAYGIAQTGDCVGAWLWNEMKAMMLLLKWTWHWSGIDLTQEFQTKLANSVTQSGTSLSAAIADAKAETLADYATELFVPGGYGYDHATHYALIGTGYNPDFDMPYQATGVIVGYDSFNISFENLWTGRPHTPVVYIQGRDPIDDATPTEYDDWGTGIARGVLTGFELDETSDADGVLDPITPSPDPASWPVHTFAPPAYGTDTMRRGSSIRAAGVLVKWNFEYT